MKNKKLFAAALTAALAVSMMGTSVMASTPTPGKPTSSTGETTFSYAPGTSGPVDPVDPGTEENSTNNWLVVYPRKVALTDSNVETANTFTKGESLKFTVKQKQAGADNDDTIKENNIPGGLHVSVQNATQDGNFALSGGAGSTGSATMQLAGFDGTTKITQSTDEMGVLTHEVDGRTQSGKAKISNNSQAVDGNTYTGKVTFLFENPGKA